ncbi:GGDEF domain-containing protein [Actinoplanes flavus]|uniref:GGDEF domain-containing protein n=1 Tax=Actinoplanes flavus TaxID=2820290 RepID=A0ABS3UJ97_9ACTN|nr:GGDEF domain-containing protein [Actinoplanes flavus]MBO3738855.1 GGDEF domain-containing protein [Actinoplanes flavus]
MAWPRATAPAWPVHAGVLGLSAAAVASYALTGPGSRTVIFALVTAAPIITYLAAIAARHLTDRLPWLIATAGMAMLTLGTLCWPDWIPGHHLGRAEGGGTDLVMAGAHVLFLAGTAIGLRRHGRKDPGGLIDAALIGLCAAGPLGAWLIRPGLVPDATPLGKMLLLSDLLLLSAVIGCLLRIGVTAPKSRGPIAYLMAAGILTLLCDVVAVLTVHGSHVPTAQLMMVAYLCVAAGPVLPTGPHVTRPAPGPATVRHPPLGWLGAALCANPAVAAVQAVQSDGPASVVLPATTILVVPVVVLRLRLLSAQRARAERTLAHQAHHDDLTGLYNRRHTVDRIDEELRALDDGPLAEVTLLLCDLDGFKPVNDRMGHQAGDTVLQEVARRLTAAVREQDLVGRIGGDEFLILLRGEHPGGGTTVADRIVESLRAPILVGGTPVRIGVSIGTAVARAGAVVDRETLIARADAAMYEVKAQRRLTATPA